MSDEFEKMAAAVIAPFSTPTPTTLRKDVAAALRRVHHAALDAGRAEYRDEISEALVHDWKVGENETQVDAIRRLIRRLSDYRTAVAREMHKSMDAVMHAASEDTYENRLHRECEKRMQNEARLAEQVKNAKRLCISIAADLVRLTGPYDGPGDLVDRERVVKIAMALKTVADSGFMVATIDTDGGERG